MTATLTSTDQCQSCRGAATLVLPFLPHSWNAVMRMDYHPRHALFGKQKTVVKRVWDQLAVKPPKFAVPVEIEVIAYFGKGARRYDADNLAIKPAIDAARGLLLENDSAEYVQRVVLMSRRDAANPRTEITFRPLPGTLPKPRRKDK